MTDNKPVLVGLKRLEAAARIAQGAIERGDHYIFVAAMADLMVGASTLPLIADLSSDCTNTEEVLDRYRLMLMECGVDMSMFEDA